MSEIFPPARMFDTARFSASYMLADMLGFGPKAEARRVATFNDHLLRDIGLSRGEIGPVAPIIHVA